uniref:Uncharacterized protein n=1 Tax=Brassica campestris TaxID=3711 RepID=A0A3P6DX08_BRACM|nr:unnamed protein product [Brassica rapa]
MNRVTVKRVVVDPDSTVNLIPMSTRHSKEKIGGALLESPIEFQVVFAPTTYYALLGRL